MKQVFMVPTPFTNELFEEFGGQEIYLFMDGFSGYHQIIIVKEDRHKTTFIIVGIFSIHRDAIWSQDCTCDLLEDSFRCV